MSGFWVVLEERDGKSTASAGKRCRRRRSLPRARACQRGCDRRADRGAGCGGGGKSLSARSCRVEHPLLAQYTADGFHLALQQLIQSENPTYVVFPHTYQVRDYAPALAARMGQVLIGDVIAIEDGPVFTRQLMQGRLSGKYRHTGDGPCFISVQAGAFRADQRRAPAPRRSRHSRRSSKPRRFAPSPASHSADRRRPSIWARRR